MEDFIRERWAGIVDDPYVTRLMRIVAREAAGRDPVDVANELEYLARYARRIVDDMNSTERGGR